MTYPTDVDDYTEDTQAILEPSFSIEPNEWFELDLISQCID